jgi:hypothetical protein
MTDNKFNSIEEAFKAGRDFERKRMFALLSDLLDSLLDVPEKKQTKNISEQKEDYKKTPPAPKRASEPNIHTMTNWKLYKGQFGAKNPFDETKGWGDLY